MMQLNELMVVVAFDLLYCILRHCRLQKKRGLKTIMGHSSSSLYSSTHIIKDVIYVVVVCFHTVKSTV
jgi:hypothetical protein